MVVARQGHVAVRLANGDVLVVGGLSDPQPLSNTEIPLSSAEVYHTLLDRFEPAGPMGTARLDFAATLLKDGKVLVEGGCDVESCASDYLGFASAELYDPSTRRFTPTGSMSVGRANQTSTLLADGRVLIVGGNTIVEDVTNTAETYDPATGRFTTTGHMAHARNSQSATLLHDGRVLVAGGEDGSNGLGTAEIYSPSTGSFTSTGNMWTPRSGHAAALLPDGRVLIVGGSVGSVTLASTEIYDPTTGQFSPWINAPATLYDLTAVTLADGRIAIIGCTDYAWSDAANVEVEIYDPAKAAFTATLAPEVRQFAPAATALTNGRLLLTGGSGESPHASVITQIMTPPSLDRPAASARPTPQPTARAGQVPSLKPETFGLTGHMTAAREGATATLLRDGRVLVTGGNDPGAADHALSSAELYDPKTGRFTPTGSMTVPRLGHTATLLGDGRALIAGGGAGDNADFLTSAEVYDPTTGRFSPTGWMTTGREDHTATLLRDGRVLVVGGDQGSAQDWVGAIASAEIYDPRTGEWTVTGSLHTPRTDHTASLLPDGRVLIAGGTDNEGDVSNTVASSEIFNPTSGRFAKAVSMHTARDGATATVLADGKVLIAGGWGSPRPSAEVYDPASGSYQVVGSMTGPRAGHIAVRLGNGTVLLAGSAGASAEIYDPVARRFRATGKMAFGTDYGGTACLLADGRVLFIAGNDSDSGETLDQAQLYQP